MQGNPDVVELLNEVLTAELTAINQYFLDAKMFENWGFDRLAAKFREESISEMKDADELIERILYLDGHPNLQRLGPVGVGETPREKFDLALQLEYQAIERLNRGIALCVEVGDNGTRELLAEILVGEEGHADYLETQIDAMDRIGVELYLSEQLHS
ncbi:MAG: bacterioferritin [Acidimicrobiia bacterium]